jgi:hypothetical protein
MLRSTAVGNLSDSVLELSRVETTNSASKRYFQAAMVE